MSATTSPVPIAPRTSRNAHSQSVQLDIRDILNELVGVLGRQLVAFIVDRDPRTVQRWTGGETPPSIDDDRVLRNTFQVFKVVSSAEASHTVRAWFMGMNPQLDDTSPAEGLVAGRLRDVMMAARAFVQGG